MSVVISIYIGNQQNFKISYPNAMNPRSHPDVLPHTLTLYVLPLTLYVLPLTLTLYVLQNTFTPWRTPTHTLTLTYCTHTHTHLHPRPSVLPFPAEHHQSVPLPDPSPASSLPDTRLLKTSSLLVHCYHLHQRGFRVTSMMYRHSEMS